MRKTVFFLALGLLTLALPQALQASTAREPEVRVFSSAGSLQDSFLAYQDGFTGGVSVAVAKQADGSALIITGAGYGGGPLVRIFRPDGTLVGFFWAYDQRVRGGVKVAAGDLDNDGVPEIVTGTYRGAGPQVRVFDLQGKPKFTPGFFPFATDFRGGVNVAVGDVDGDGFGEIVAGVGQSAYPHVRIFDRYGKTKNLDIFPFSTLEQGGVAVTAGNIDGGIDDEVIVSVQHSGKPWVKVYKADAERTILGDFYAYAETYLSGVQVAAGDIDGDGFAEVVVAPTVTGGPHVRGFEGYGTPVRTTFMAYENDFRGGVNLAAGDLDDDGTADIVTGPARRIAEGRTDYQKYIEIDISDQMLTYYENGFKVDSYRVSTGKWDMPTPIGEFRVLNKIPRAYSKKYDLYMPWWMAFNYGSGEGSYGLHELPEWANGTKEGVNHLGVRVSHGCIRLGVGPAKTLYDWAPVGTPVIVKQ